MPQFPPKNKGSILNYDLDIDLLIQDGYKPFVPAEIPETIRMYHFEYEETDVIREVVVYDETKAQANARLATQRQQELESQFIETSMKDSNGNNSYYRQVPQGYANAPQTIQLVDKYVRDFEGMTEQIAQMLIFYEKPDFTKAEECTEEWLVAHQFNPPADMTLQEWKAFEFDFQQRWALLKYKQQEVQ